MSKPYSLSVKQGIIAMHDQGHSCGSISLRLNISKSRVAVLINRYLKYGSSGLPRLPEQVYTPDFKADVVRCVLEKRISLGQAALHYGISASAAYSWVQRVKAEGYDSLSQIKPRGRPPKPMGRPKKKEPQTELEKLQYEVEYLRTENALLKKVRALVQERIARESGKKPKPSKN